MPGGRKELARKSEKVLRKGRKRVVLGAERMSTEAEGRRGMGRPRVRVGLAVKALLGFGVPRWGGLGSGRSPWERDGDATAPRGAGKACTGVHGVCPLLPRWRLAWGQGEGIGRYFAPVDAG